VDPAGDAPDSAAPFLISSGCRCGGRGSCAPQHRGVAARHRLSSAERVAFFRFAGSVAPRRCRPSPFRRRQPGAPFHQLPRRRAPHIPGKFGHVPFRSTCSCSVGLSSRSSAMAGPESGQSRARLLLLCLSSSLSLSLSLSLSSVSLLGLKAENLLEKPS
jgi:hypothetical protein